MQHKAASFSKCPYHESLLLFSCLEAAMTKFGGCVNELQVNLLQGPALGLYKQGLQDREQVSMQQHPFSLPVGWLLLITPMANT